MRQPIIIGTRGSDLALWQANYVKDLLHELGHECSLKIIKTQGDIMKDLSPDKMEGKGFFTKEVEDALLSRETDIAVHSYKDLPTESTKGLIIGAVSDREDPSELLLISKDAVDAKKPFDYAQGPPFGNAQGKKFNLKSKAKVGTSSARRKSQLLAFRPDLELVDIRGNVPTRIQKLRDKQYDAILIAAAGVERLGIDVSEFHSEKIDPTEIIPAPAQGVLAIQIRESDVDLKKILGAIENSSVRKISDLERRILNLFQGGCQTPVGVYASFDEEQEMFFARAAKASSWDQMPVSVFSSSKDPVQLAERIVEKIKKVSASKVFLTRKSRGESYLKNVLEGNGYSLVEKALIEMIPVKFSDIPKCEWIFFSSKHAVKFFFEQQPKLNDQKFACVGKATADALRQYGKRAAFIGSSTDTRMTGKQFASLTGSSKILFPQAKGSMKSIQQQIIKKENVLDLVVYETLKKNDGEKPDANIVVFTSPSNVEAWFERYDFPKSMHAIAMGDATAHTLKQKKVYAAATVDTFDDTGIARAVFGVGGTTND